MGRTRKHIGGSRTLLISSNLVDITHSFTKKLFNPTCSLGAWLLFKIRRFASLLSTPFSDLNLVCSFCSLSWLNSFLCFNAIIFNTQNPGRTQLPRTLLVVATFLLICQLILEVASGVYGYRLYTTLRTELVLTSSLPLGAVRTYANSSSNLEEGCGVRGVPMGHVVLPTRVTVQQTDRYTRA
jgi:hypothetical protein